MKNTMTTTANVLVPQLKRKHMNWKIELKKLPRMQLKETRRKKIEKRVRDKEDKSNILTSLPRISEEEGKINGTEAMSEKRLAERFPELMKDTTPQTQKAQ